MNIVCKADVEFLQVNVMGESQHLNPFSINIEQIRYIREFKNETSKQEWAIVIGGKMYPTRDLDFSEVKIGDVVEIGKTKFECCLTTSLTEKSELKTLVNHKNTLYVRKFLKNDNKNDSKSSEKLDKFAIITIDERIVPIVSNKPM